MHAHPACKSSRRSGGALAAILLVAAGAFATGPQAQSGAASAGTTERVTIQSKALEGNLIGDSPTRDVSVYLPPGYAQSRTRRYPVVYLLHGFTDSDAKWFGLDGKHWINLPNVLNRAMGGASSSDVKELIVVMPNAFNAFQGSMYSSSATIGDWERFVAEELVAFIDQRYRTIASRNSRGLAGHSMGGYGTLRIGMKHPQVFSSIYALSPCCLGPISPQSDGKPSPAEAVKSKEEIAKADFGVKAQLASAAAWSPNPNAPPFFLDLPTKNGEVRPEVVARFAANAPLALVHQYLFNLRSLKGIAFDAGTADKSIHATSVELDRILSAYQLAHDWGSYEGDHLNRVAERIEKVMLPFFARHLVF
jgi:S-formylglutathione hydrolase